MKCSCGGTLRVYTWAKRQAPNRVKRYRKCDRCGKNFATVEMYEWHHDRTKAPEDALKFAKMVPM